MVSTSELAHRQTVFGFVLTEGHAANQGLLTRREALRNMSRVVLVSNRVLDLSKGTRAGGVAVVLANIVRTRKALWFGWNGDIKPAKDVNRAKGADRHHSALGHRIRRLLPWLRQFRPVARISQSPRPRQVRGWILRAIRRRQQAPRRPVAANAETRRCDLGTRL